MISYPDQMRSYSNEFSLNSFKKELHLNEKLRVLKFEKYQSSQIIEKLVQLEQEVEWSVYEIK